MNENGNERRDGAAVVGCLPDEAGEMRRGMLETRAHLLRAMDCLAAEERDSLTDPVHTAVGRALGVLTRALVPAAEQTDEGDEEGDWDVAGPHPTAAEEGGVAWLTAAYG